MFQATLRQLARHGVGELPKAVLADAGYWHTAQMQRIAERGIEVLIPPDGTMREGKRPGWENGLYALMRERLSTEDGKRALRPAQENRRAGLRANQIQPADRPVHAKRQGRRAVGMAVGGSNPQSPQAPQPLDSQHRLTPPQADTRDTVPRNRPSNQKCAILPYFPTASRPSGTSRRRGASGRRASRRRPSGPRLVAEALAR